ncbi:MAG TPA: transporter substrate-binding domain-containing protein [Jatrophihabitantaceae bacterium]
MTKPAVEVVTDLAPTGVLRAAINLGNPVLAHGTADAPAGVTVDIARELAARLEVPVQFTCFDAARKSFAAMAAGDSDICFLAIEPARTAEVAFTAPYVVIEGVFAVVQNSDIVRTSDVDREHVRVGVKEGSAYDLFLSRTLRQAHLVRGDEGTGVFSEQGLEVAAGIRQPVTAFVERTPGLRLLDEPFMAIRQAVGTTRNRLPDTVQFLAASIEELKGSGFIRAALDRAGHVDVTVAGPAAK